jgi:hypothetical protein
MRGATTKEQSSSGSTESERRMRYVAFVGTDGRAQPEIVEEMNRDWPAYEAELQRRLPWRAGRELDLPDRGVKVVSVRDGRALVTDGPFAETKEYIAGLDIFECADLDEAIELEGKSPVARFLPFEIRQLPDEFRLGSGLAAFGDCDDSQGVPFLLATWHDGDINRESDAQALTQRYDAWQRDLDTRGAFIFGGAIAGPATAVTLRPVDRAVQATAGSFITADAYVSGVDVVRARDWDEALSLTAGHPFAEVHAIEVRSFYSAAT